MKDTYCESVIFDENKISKFPPNPVVAMAYVPYQNATKLYTAEQGLFTGTMFPCLDKPFKGSCGGAKK